MTHEEITERLALRGQVSPASSLDGYRRSDDAEERINAAFRLALSGTVGQVVMDYLRSITVNTVMPQSASDAALRDQEGMRRLFGIIDARRNSNPISAKE